MHLEQNVSTGAKLIQLEKVPFNECTGHELAFVRITGNGWFQRHFSVFLKGSQNSNSVKVGNICDKGKDKKSLIHAESALSLVYVFQVEPSSMQAFWH